MKRILGIACSFAVFFAFAGCQMLQENLSDSMNESKAEEIGNSYVESTTYYYNGCSLEDMSSGPMELEIKFTKKAEISESGVSGNFVVAYLDKDGNSASVTKNVAGGEMDNSTGKSYYLDVSPVSKVLDGAMRITKDNEAVASIKLSGFIRKGGDEKGGVIPPFQKKIEFKPLWDKSAVINSASEIKIERGKSIVLATKFPSEADISDVTISVAGTDGASLPEGIDGSCFALEINSSTLRFKNVKSLPDESFAIDVTLSGIKVSGAKSPYTKTFKFTHTKN